MRVSACKRPKLRCGGMWSCGSRSSKRRGRVDDNPGASAGIARERNVRSGFGTAPTRRCRRALGPIANSSPRTARTRSDLSDHARCLRGGERLAPRNRSAPSWSVSSTDGPHRPKRPLEPPRGSETAQFRFALGLQKTPKQAERSRGATN